jgi:hypothetical protein
MADASQMSAPARLQPVRYGISQGAASRMRQQTMPLAGPAGRMPGNGIPQRGSASRSWVERTTLMVSRSSRRSSKARISGWVLPNAPVNAGARIWLGGVPRGSAHHLAQRHHGRTPSVGRGGSQRAPVRDLRRHGRDGAVMGGSTRIRMRRGRLGHVYLPFVARWPAAGYHRCRQARILARRRRSRYRLSQPRRGTTSVTSAGDHDDRAAGHQLLR